MTMKVIYHADCQDGFCAAWVAYRKYGAVEFIPAQYGDDPPQAFGNDILILDFSYPRAVLERMHAEADSLLVLDHHKTAAMDLEGLPYAVFDINRSGAGLAWDVLFGGRMRVPLVDYCEDRDLWRWMMPRSREVNAYVDAVERTFRAWDGVHADLLSDANRIADLGSVALKVTERYVEEKRKGVGRATIGGYRVPCVNTTFAISETVGALAEGEVFAAGWFQKDDGSFIYSLRSRQSSDMDVSQIARQYGGGGHRGAAGFTVKELLK